MDKCSIIKVVSIIIGPIMIGPSSSHTAGAILLEDVQDNYLEELLQVFNVFIMNRLLRLIKGMEQTLQLLVEFWDLKRMMSVCHKRLRLLLKKVFQLNLLKEMSRVQSLMRIQLI